MVGIVCLCGSTKFKEEFEEVNKLLTLEGYVVLSVGCFMHHDGHEITDIQKKQLDNLHLRKIDLADFVFFIDVDGYMGKSTIREFNYAQNQGKPCVFYSQWIK